MRLALRSTMFVAVLSAAGAAMVGACGDGEGGAGTVTDSGWAAGDAHDSAEPADLPAADTAPPGDIEEPDLPPLDAPDALPADPGDDAPDPVDAPDAEPADPGPQDAEEPDVQPADSGPADIAPQPPDPGPPPCLCSDGNPCTLDKCEADGGCLFVPVPLPCDDGDPCTAGDVCDDGACLAGAIPVTCDDGTPCTVDTCVPGAGCSHVPGNDGSPCDDGNVCTTSDQCAAGACAGTGVLDCDDGDVCTDDHCDASTGCHHETETACDDDNPCTADSCDKETGCQHASLPDGASCSDADPCTGGDKCQGGACQPGAEPAECDDANPCTSDSCTSGVGCKYTPVENGAPCDDGNPATTSDACKYGKCFGKGDDCAAWLSQLDPTGKVTGLALLESTAGAFDLDGDGKPDNAAGILAGILNPELMSSIESGAMVNLIHLAGFDTGGNFPGYFFVASLAPENPSCKVQAQVCDYLLDPGSFDEACNPLAIFPELDYEYGKGKLVSASAGTFELAFSFAGALYSIPVHMAKLDMDLKLSEDWLVASFSGKLGGAIAMADLKAVLAKIPDLPLPPGLIDLLLTPDIDADGDGKDESVSLAASLSGIGGNIVGVEPE